jgi:hypothetical protein
VERALHFLLRCLEFAGELGVEIALAVDVADEIVFRLRRALRREAGLLRRSAQRGELRLPLFERLPRFLQLVERARMRRDALAIEPGERRDGAR